ncbi:MAG TPA: GspH/FimT family pseudopilin [Oxalicibacterium sp.]|nr:GspH/FimT family pseudopilin [Oxalicibacterium sp.]
MTAIELMFALAIACMLLAIGISSFASLIRHQKLTATANMLFTAVNLARSEAIHRGRRVDLVPAGERGNWQDGWIVFIDDNGNQRPDAGETVIRTYPAVDRDMRIVASFTDSKVQYVAFIGSGRTRTNGGSQTSQSGNWRLELGEQSRKIVINFLGRPRVCDPDQEAATC